MDNARIPVSKILIVKLGAMGDVLRTTPLLAALKRIYPAASVTWVVDAESSPVLQGNPLIDRLLIYSAETLQMIPNDRYDLAINLDKEKEALDSIGAANAAVKKGFGWDSERKGVAPLNPSSDYAVRLGIDDELKFKTNQKTYQEISFEQVEIPYAREEYMLSFTEAETEYARKTLASAGAQAVGGWSSPGLRSGAIRIGINTGSGDRFAGKRLPEAHVAELAKLFTLRLGAKVFLLGGPQEHERNRRIEQVAQPYAVNAGTAHTIRQFAAIVSQLNLVVSGDTIAMHVAVAAKVPVVAFFGSTCAAEIELYGRGKKIVTEIPCAPCYKRICPINDQCMEEMSVDRIFRDSEELLKTTPAAAVAGRDR